MDGGKKPNQQKKARIAAEIKAFKNTDFSDAPELTDEQLAQMRPSHYRSMANYKPIKRTVVTIQSPAGVNALENKKSFETTLRLNSYERSMSGLMPM
jgi:hypothetical protein